MSNNGKPLWMRDLGDYPEALALSPGGEALAVGLVEGAVAVLDPHTGEWRRKFKAHGAGLVAVGWAGEATIVTAGMEGRVAWWDAATGSQIAEHTPAGGGPIAALATMGNGNVVIAAAGKRAFVYTAPGSIPQASDEHPSAVVALDITPDGGLAAAGCLGRITGWHLDKPGNPAVVAPVDSMPMRLMISPGGRWIAAICHDCSLRLYSADDQRESDLALGPLRRRARALDWGAGGRWLAVANEEVPIMVDTMALASAQAMSRADGEDFPEASLSAIVELPPAAELIGALAFHPEGPWLAWGDGGGNLTLWSSEVTRWHTHWGGGEVVHLRWLDAHTLLAASAEGMVAAFEV